MVGYVYDQPFCHIICYRPTKSEQLFYWVESPYFCVLEKLNWILINFTAMIESTDREYFIHIHSI